MAISRSGSFHNHKSVVPRLTQHQAANILVDDDTRCVISDFGQSEMKSEVYRISRAPVPRKSDRSSFFV
jgi:hypothetical protein